MVWWERSKGFRLLVVRRADTRENGRIWYSVVKFYLLLRPRWLVQHIWPSGRKEIRPEPAALTVTLLFQTPAAQQAYEKLLQEPESFEVLGVLVFIQVQVAVWTGDLKEVSLRQTQLTGDVLPQRAQRIIIPRETHGEKGLSDTFNTCW